MHSHNQRNLFTLRTIRSNWQWSMMQIWHEYFEKFGCWYAYIHTYIHTHINSSLSFNVCIRTKNKTLLHSHVLRLTLHCRCFRNITSTLAVFSFFVEFIPLCYITLKINKRISPPIFNTGFQAFTAGLTTVRFWHCVGSWVDRTFRRNVLRPSTGWRNYVHVDAKLYLQAIPSQKTVVLRHSETSVSKSKRHSS